jgi:hypothetical protein
VNVQWALRPGDFIATEDLSVTGQKFEARALKAGRTVPWSVAGAGPMPADTALQISFSDVRQQGRLERADAVDPGSFRHLGAIDIA